VLGVGRRDLPAARRLALDRGRLSQQRLAADGTVRTVPMRRVRINDAFFSSWSAQMAYVLGVIYTDGCLHPGKDTDPHARPYKSSLSIGQKETELLTKLLALMKCDARILHTPRREYPTGAAGEMHSISICNSRVYSDLLAIGLTPRKSRTLVFPEVPSAHTRHFTRGCWDGDGSVFISKGTGMITASYVSGSRTFIDGMLSKLYAAGFQHRTVHRTSGPPPSYYFRLYGSQCVSLFHYLYDGVPPEQYLERKHRVFTSYIAAKVLSREGATNGGAPP
jgi:hypothetical protein